VTATFVGLLLHLWWIQGIFPMTNRWVLPVGNQDELLVAVRPCRGAMLWEPGDSRRYAREVGLLDGVWLRFADRRNGGREVWAVSVSSTWRPEYLWLTRAEIDRLRVRQDDPAVMRCDERPRRERVAPASWHVLGFE
jgi:hypothetical protein